MLCIYSLFKQFRMLWVDIRIYPYAIIAMEGGRRTCWFWVNTGYNPHKYDMVNTKIHSRLDYTFIVCIYKVFKHLPMLWMNIRMYPSPIIAMEKGRTCWFWVNLGTIHTSMTWLSPRLTPGWIALSSYVYIKCLSTFPCCGWTYECILMP